MSDVGRKRKRSVGDAESGDSSSNEDVMTLLRSMRKELKQQTSETKKLRVNFEILSESVNQLKWSACFKEMNPWLEMAETERSRMRDTRAKFFQYLGITEATATCWVSGIQNVPASKNVIVSHILPDSSKNSVLERLKLDFTFKNDYAAKPSNFLLLDKKIEDAFDHLKLSFVPIDILHPTTFKLVCWTDEVITLSDGSLFDCSGEPRLNLPEGFAPSRRAMSYQALCAYIYNAYKHRTGEYGKEVPTDFSSEYVGKDATYKKRISGAADDFTQRRIRRR